MRNFWKWMGVFGAATAADLLARFGLSFEMTRVLTVEAVLTRSEGPSSDPPSRL